MRSIGQSVQKLSPGNRDRHIDTQIDRHTDTQNHRHTDRQTEGQTYVKPLPTRSSGR